MTKRKRERTKLKFTIASFIFHITLGLIFALYTKVDNAAIWVAFFSSFDITFAVYTAGKIAKDKIVLEERKELGECDGCNSCK